MGGKKLFSRPDILRFPAGLNLSPTQGLPSQVSASVSSGESGSENTSPVLGGSRRPTPGPSLTCSAGPSETLRDLSFPICRRVWRTPRKASPPPPSWDLQLWRCFLTHALLLFPAEAALASGLEGIFEEKYETESWGKGGALLLPEAHGAGVRP